MIFNDSRSFLQNVWPQIRIGECLSCWIGGQGPQIWEYAWKIIQHDLVKYWQIRVRHDLQYIFLNTGFLVHLIGSTKLVYNLLMAFKIQGTPLHCSLHWKKSLRWQESTGRSSVMTCRLWVSHLIRQDCQQVWDNLMSGDLKPALWTTTGCSTGNEIGVRGGRKYTFANAEYGSCYIANSFSDSYILVFPPACSWTDWIGGALLTLKDNIFNSLETKREDITWTSPCLASTAAAWFSASCEWRSCVHFSESDQYQNVAISCETHPPGVWPPTGRHLAPHSLPADLCIAPIPDVGW